MEIKMDTTFRVCILIKNQIVLFYLYSFDLFLLSFVKELKVIHNTIIRKYANLVFPLALLLR